MIAQASVSAVAIGRFLRICLSAEMTGASNDRSESICTSHRMLSTNDSGAPATATVPTLMAVRRWMSIPRAMTSDFVGLMWLLIYAHLGVISNNLGGLNNSLKSPIIGQHSNMFNLSMHSVICR